MNDAFAVVCAVLADPAASRVLIEQLSRLPAAVRRHKQGAPANRYPGLPDLQHAEVWKALAREDEC